MEMVLMQMFVVQLCRVRYEAWPFVVVVVVLW